MQKSKYARSGLLGAAVMATFASSLDMRLIPRTANANSRQAPPDPKIAMDREIAEHNAEVERRKAEKRAAKQPSRSKRLREAGFTRRPSAKSLPSDE